MEIVLWPIRSEDNKDKEKLSFVTEVSGDFTEYIS